MNCSLVAILQNLVGQKSCPVGTHETQKPAKYRDTDEETLVPARWISESNYDQYHTA